MSLFSPPGESGALPGTFAAYLQDQARSQGWETIEAPGDPELVREADCIFLTNAIGEIRSVTRWDQRELPVLGSTPAGAALLNLIESGRDARADLDLSARP
jgi:branched-subunit amino acid aminotransferase/4-amino-4-deoxychorismate lyase